MTSLRSLLTIALAAFLAACSRPDDRPNIVFFLVDDLGWQDTSVPLAAERTPFNDFYRTPNMAELARRGVKCTNAYAHTVCSPTRVSVMTGQHPARHHVTNWVATEDVATGQNDSILPPEWSDAGLQPGTTSLASLLDNAGYRTIHCGKSHWAAPGTPGADPRALGFEIAIAGTEVSAVHHLWPDAELDIAASPWADPRLAKYRGTTTPLTEALTREAIAEIESAARDGEPFFLHLAHYAVHQPLYAHTPYYQRYHERGTNEREARYASMVEGVDASLGAIMATLDRLRIADRTIIVCYSDNGGLSYQGRGETPQGTKTDTHNGPLREGKGSAYEGGTRVPLFVAWAATPTGAPRLPEMVPGSTCHVPITCEDMLPTLCTWAGVDWHDAAHPIDGEDVTPYLCGATPVAPRPIVFHFPHKWGPPLSWGPDRAGYQPYSAIRLGSRKAIFFYETSEWRLFDLDADPGEATDLAAAEPAVLRGLADELVAVLSTRHAQWPRRKKSGADIVPALAR